MTPWAAYTKRLGMQRHTWLVRVFYPAQKEVLLSQKKTRFPSVDRRQSPAEVRMSSRAGTPFADQAHTCASGADE